MLKSGLYEKVINKELGEQLESQKDKLSKTTPLDEAESAKILSKYVAQVIEKGLDNLIDNGGGIESQISLVNKLVSTVKVETSDSDFIGMEVDKRAEQLLALLDKTNTIYGLNEKAEIVRPVTSLSQSSLFTGAIHEPQMYTELKKEIISCNRIDMLVSFIKWSGLRLIIDELKAFTSKGGKLRIITTSYMGATDIKAVDELSKLPNTEVKVSYDTKRTRLHAKTYVFYRDTDFTTAYVGSSNLSNAAISSGLEWNVKVTKQDLPDTIKKISATFDSYWNSDDFEIYSYVDKQRLERALKAEKYFDGNSENTYTFDITPYPYQQEILDKLRAEREVRGNYKNLVVAATGTGKTVISALDFKDFIKKNRQAKLLFVAHREEILKQSIACFRGVLKDANFGNLFVGSYKTDSLENLFVSVQTFNSQDLTKITSPGYYDYIIVDEFHHAAALTYQKLLTYYKPKILLGLTATPERMDGKSILEYFNNRISAEIRLPEAIDRKLLCPFQYFGVTDTVDLDSLKWERGGYSKSELTNVYAFSEAVSNRRANLIIQSLLKYVTDLDAVKGLGFCVSKEHAKYMSDYFNEHNIPSMFLVSETSDEERRAAKQRLINGDIRFIFVVDIYNEGVDIPEINTVLFLRPTESLTIFLQQLGRGLRLCEGKECLTVLDFIGQANKNYNFESKFEALLSHFNGSVLSEIKNGFVSAPKGCYIQLEKKSKEYILENIRASLNSKNWLLVKIKTFVEDSGLNLSLINFARFYHVDAKLIYSKKWAFYSMCEQAGLWPAKKHIFADPARILFHFCYVDSKKWIDFILSELSRKKFKVLSDYNDEDKLMIKMLYSSIWNKTPITEGFNDEVEALNTLFEDEYFIDEVKDIMSLCKENIDIVGQKSNLDYICPLEVYCTYTRSQALAALGFQEDYSVSEGVKYLKEKNTDLFFITLNKSDNFYSPTTAYNDYSINETIFHWQSQSTTSDISPTGHRYINHDSMSNTILLFVREVKSDQYGAQAFIFLGKAHYVGHEGSKPMNVLWKLENKIPAKFLSKTNKLLG
ncbi:MAG: DUF3427 domain-containing protein [Clostridiales bacterium]|nr:DUF3427 domain-containing protein [Clostridiales bacterium]